MDFTDTDPFASFGAPAPAPQEVSLSDQVRAGDGSAPRTPASTGGEGPNWSAIDAVAATHPDVRAKIDAAFAKPSLVPSIWDSLTGGLSAGWGNLTGAVGSLRTVVLVGAAVVGLYFVSRIAHDVRG